MRYYGINDLLLDPFICINKMLVGLIQNCDRGAARSINFLLPNIIFLLRVKAAQSPNYLVVFHRWEEVEL